jgi:pimeloyl-ACP methyl ester carboxylesterase
MTTQTGFAPTNGTSLYYEITGSGDPVVLLHGFSFNHRMWDDQADALSERYMVVRYDLRGFGRSAPSEERYAHADDLKALLDHLAIGRTALMGLSLGGGAAINFSVIHPERVRALIVVDPSLGGFPWSEEFVTAQRELAATAREGGVEAARKRWLSIPIFTHTLANPAAAPRLRALVEDYSGWHWINPDPGRPFSPPAIERLGEITAPALVIVGELDTLDFQRIADTLAQSIPNARKEVLPGAGHMANLERPERFNELVLDFLNDVRT